MSVQESKIKEKLFTLYKIVFSLLIIPVMGLIVYKTMETEKGRAIWQQEYQFKDEGEFALTSYNQMINDYLKNKSNADDKIKYMVWSAEPIPIRDGAVVVRVKYQIQKSSGAIKINDMLFIIENNEIKQTVLLD
jgi:hypothetical protein